jgi:hypothetical protein
MVLLNSISKTVSDNVLLFLFSSKLDFKNIQRYNTVKLISFNQNCQHCQHTNIKHRHKNGTRVTGSYWALCSSFLVVLSQHVQLQHIMKRIGHTVQFINSMNHVNRCLFMNMSLLLFLIYPHPLFKKYSCSHRYRFHLPLVAARLVRIFCGSKLVSCTEIACKKLKHYIRLKTIIINYLMQWNVKILDFHIKDPNKIKYHAIYRVAEKH